MFFKWYCSSLLLLLLLILSFCAGNADDIDDGSKNEDLVTGGDIGEGADVVGDPTDGSVAGIVAAGELPRDCGCLCLDQVFADDDEL